VAEKKTAKSDRALAQIVRHPIKSVGFEELPAVTLTPDAPLPWDRHWAVAHKAARFRRQPRGLAAEAELPARLGLGRPDGGGAAASTTGQGGCG
jgi:uncharacterized protein YcbX